MEIMKDKRTIQSWERTGICRVYTINLGPMKAATGTILITRQEIDNRIAEIGRQISSDYAGREILFVGILKGSFVFLSDLIRAISSEIPIEVDFMSVSSYGDSTSSSGTVHIEKDMSVPVDGKNIIIVEDIVDTGLTLLHVHNILGGRGAKSIRVATLLENRAIANTNIHSITSDSRSRTSSLSVSGSTTRSTIVTFPRFVF